jgi:hypothetical protein
VSRHNEIQPNEPMDNFGRMTVPFAADTRASSTAQSSTLKYSSVPPAPGFACFDYTSAPAAP